MPPKPGKKPAPRRGPPHATPITPIRFTPADLAMIETLRAHHGAPTVAALLRLLVVAEYRRLDPRPATSGPARPAARNRR